MTSSDEMKKNAQALFEYWGPNSFSKTLPPHLQQALDEGNVDVHARDDGGQTLLHFAVKLKTPDTASRLLDLGADIEARNDHECTPIYWAGRDGMVETLKMLVERGAEWDVGSSTDSSPLHWAATNYRSEVARYLLEQGADKNAPNSYGMTPLHETARCGAPNAARALLDYGADCEARNNNGHTPLLNSRQEANTAAQIIMMQDQVTLLLLAAGANINVEDLAGNAMWAKESSKVFFDRQNEVALPVLDAWVSGQTDPAELTPAHVFQMLSVWPLADPKAPVPRFEHLEAIFSDARWKDEHAEHKLDLIQQIPGLTPREQMFLMGGHARSVLQRQQAGKEVER